MSKKKDEKKESKKLFLSLYFYDSDVREFYSNKFEDLGYTSANQFAYDVLKNFYDTYQTGTKKGKDVDKSTKATVIKSKLKEELTKVIDKLNIG